MSANSVDKVVLYALVSKTWKKTYSAARSLQLSTVSLICIQILFDKVYKENNKRDMEL